MILLVLESHDVQVQKIAVHLTVTRRRVPPTVRYHPDTLWTLTYHHNSQISANIQRTHTQDHLMTMFRYSALIIFTFLKHHKVVTSEVLMMVELVVKGRVKDKSYELKYKNCLTGAFVAWLSTKDS